MVSSRAVPITHARAATDSEDGICSGKMLTNFCFICSLRTGTLFCGVVSLILSTLGIIADGALQIQYHIYLPLERSLIFEETLIFVVSLLCIHGAMKESKYTILPWLVVIAITITILFLTAIYYIILRRSDLTIIGLALLIFAALSVYGWMGVASYYTELREHPCAVRQESAIVTTPPPSYSVAVGTTDKPPSYEEAESRKRVVA